MWLMTFHAACARILRTEAERLGYTRQFTIYDQADARRLTKRCIDELGIDPKRYTPAALHNQISAAKNKLLDAEAYQQAVGCPFEEMVGEVYRLYERDMLRSNAMDFDDLLFRTVNLLELFEEVRERYSETFSTCWSTSTRTPTTRSTGSCSCWWVGVARPRRASTRLAIDPRTQGRSDTATWR